MRLFISVDDNPFVVLLRSAITASNEDISSRVVVNCSSTALVSLSSLAESITP